MLPIVYSEAAAMILDYVTSPMDMHGKRMIDLEWGVPHSKILPSGH